MKAILVIDIPEEYMGSNIDVKLYGKYQTIHEKYVNKLRPLPRYFTLDEILSADGIKPIEMRAYNDCLDEITGETE